MSTAAYFPGKIGDAIHQWPVMYWWHKQKQKPFQCWLDPTCKPLVNLFAAQPGVESVKLAEPADNYMCGGQPWGGKFSAQEREDREIICLGMRAFPQRQLTLQCFHDVPGSVQVDPQELAETPVFEVPEMEPKNRVVLHGTGICYHNKQSPGFWKFLASIRRDLEYRFEEIIFVGSESDREVGMSAYPLYNQWADDGDFLKLASYMKASRLVIGCGSSPAALAGALKVPCIRVHDDISGAPRVIWSNLGSNQLNEPEFELRKSWPEFRDKFLAAEVKA